MSIVLIAYLLTSFAINTTQLALIRAFSGIGCGLLIAKCHALIASNNNPEKSYAFFSLSSTVVGAIIIYVSGSILNNFGYQFFFISLFVFYLMLMPLILFIKEKPVNEVISPISEDLKYPEFVEKHYNKEIEDEEDEKRMNIIGQNGNDGLHYEEVSNKVTTPRNDYNAPISMVPPLPKKPKIRSPPSLSFRDKEFAASQ